MPTQQFLKTLQKQAKFQSQLNEQSMVPVPLKPLAALIGNYPWQTLLLISGLTALVLNFGMGGVGK